MKTELKVKERLPVCSSLAGSIRKAAVVVVLWVLATGPGLAEVHLGMRLGGRTVFDERIVEVYGEGFLYSPFLRLTSERTLLGLELAYEGGFQRDGAIGLFQESSRLSLTGIEVAAILRRRFGPLVPYLKAGIGYFFYKQDVDSQEVRFKVNRNQQQVVLGGGLDIRLPKGFYLTSEFKYVPLKVAPFDRIVDLGGLRFLAGIGWSFDLKPRRRIRDID